MDNVDKSVDKLGAALANAATAMDYVVGSTGLESAAPSNISNLVPKIGVDKCGHIEKVWTNRKERMGKFTWGASDYEELLVLLTGE